MPDFEYDPDFPAAPDDEIVTLIAQELEEEQ